VLIFCDCRQLIVIVGSIRRHVLRSNMFHLLFSQNKTFEWTFEYTSPIVLSFGMNNRFVIFRKEPDARKKGEKESNRLFVLFLLWS